MFEDFPIYSNGTKSGTLKTPVDFFFGEVVANPTHECVVKSILAHELVYDTILSLDFESTMHTTSKAANNVGGVWSVMILVDCETQPSRENIPKFYSAPLKQQCIEVVMWSGQYRKRAAESCEVVPVVPGG